MNQNIIWYSAEYVDTNTHHANNAHIHRQTTHIHQCTCTHHTTTPAYMPTCMPADCRPDLTAAATATATATDSLRPHCREWGTGSEALLLPPSCFHHMHHTATTCTHRATATCTHRTTTTCTHRTTTNNTNYYKYHHSY